MSGAFSEFDFVNYFLCLQAKKNLVKRKIASKHMTTQNGPHFHGLVLLPTTFLFEIQRNHCRKRRMQLLVPG